MQEIARILCVQFSPVRQARRHIHSFRTWLATIVERCLGEFKKCNMSESVTVKHVASEWNAKRARDESRFTVAPASDVRMSGYRLLSRWYFII